MSDNVPGFVFLINIEHKRSGSDVDIQLAKKTFEYFGASAEVWTGKDSRGITKEEIKKKIENLKSPDWQKKLEACKYVVFLFASHGLDDLNVQFFNNNKEELVNIRLLLLTPLIKMKVLDNKLKWLIIQSCRGPNTFVKKKTDGDESLYFYNHFLISCPTGEGGKSFRFKESHALFLKKLLTLLKENEDLGIKQVLRLVDVALQDAIVDGMPNGCQLTQSVAISENFENSDFYLKDACFKAIS